MNEVNESLLRLHRLCRHRTELAELVEAALAHASLLCLRTDKSTPYRAIKEVLRACAEAGADRFDELAAMLTRFREASTANKVEAIVTISPAAEVAHSQIVKVMDACSLAGIEAVNFALGEE